IQRRRPVDGVGADPVEINGPAGRISKPRRLCRPWRSPSRPPTRVRRSIGDFPGPIRRLIATIFDRIALVRYDEAGGSLIPQSVQLLKTADGIRLAWTRGGAGRPLLKAANWLTHLNYDHESPVWRHWVRFLEGHFDFIRYDARGCGLTDWHVGDLSPERWEEDLAAVAKASTPGQKNKHHRKTQGTTAAGCYAVHHPERVSH